MRDQIEKQYTLLSYLYFSLYSGAGVVLLSAAFSLLSVENSQLMLEILLSAGAVFFTIMGYGLYRNIVDDRAIEKRASAVAALSIQKGWQSMPFEQQPSIKYSSLYALADRERHFANYIKGQDWEYVDLSYAIYKETKNSEYKAATAYAAVMYTKLPRQLPNVVFDSLNHHGKQFRKVFQDDQLHRLEGGFDQYFNTYFAEDYTIDSMSFITPDVMEAMIAASDYDIEIVGDHLLMYGPVYAPVEQIPDMGQKIETIKKQLLDNILTYRDERLPYAEGRSGVAPKGMYLKRRKATVWVTVITLIIYFGFRIYLDMNRGQ